MDDLMPLQHARARLGVSDSTIRRWIKRGKVGAETREGRFGPELWCRVADVEAVAAQRQALGLLPSALPRLRVAP